MNLLRVACAALVACAAGTAVATPAKADWDGRHWRHYHGQWRGPDYRYYRYRPPVVVYAPPPVYYAPPPPVYYAPGVTFGFTIR